MTDTPLLQRNSRPIRREVASHLFVVGQIVRLKDGFGQPLNGTDIYHITATMPPRGNSPQYRIRNDAERYERVATQDSLEPVSMSLAKDDTTLAERTFGSGQETETQQSQDS